MGAAARKAVRVSIRDDLLLEARSLGVDLSRAAELGLEQAVRLAREAAWRRENRPGVEEYNARVDAGDFDEFLRRF